MENILENKWILVIISVIVILALAGALYIFIGYESEPEPDVKLTENKGNISAKITETNKNIEQFRIENDGEIYKKKEFPDDPDINDSASIKPIGNGTVKIIAISSNSEEYVVNSTSYNYERPNAEVNLDNDSGEIIATVLRNKNVDKFRLENNKSTDNVDIQFNGSSTGEKAFVSPIGNGTIRVIGVMSDGREVVINKINYDYESPSATVNTATDLSGRKISVELLRNENVDDFYIEHNGITYEKTEIPDNFSVGDQASIKPASTEGSVLVNAVMPSGREFTLTTTDYEFEIPNATVEINQNRKNISVRVVNNTKYVGFTLTTKEHYVNSVPSSRTTSKFPIKLEVRDTATMVPRGDGTLLVIGKLANGREFIVRQSNFDYEEPNGSVNLNINRNSAEATVLRNENIDNFKLVLTTEKDSKVTKIIGQKSGSNLSVNTSQILNNYHPTINDSIPITKNITTQDTLSVSNSTLTGIEEIIYNKTNVTNDFVISDKENGQIKYENNSTVLTQGNNLRIKYSIEQKPILNNARVIAVMSDGRELVMENKSTD